MPDTATETSDDTRGYRRGRAKRAEILDAAMRLFAEVGYHSASLRDIANSAGITHPGLLHHFPTKSALLGAVLARRDELDEAELNLSKASGLDLVTGIVELMERNQARPWAVELFATLSAEATWPEHPAHEYFVERYATLRRRAAEAFEAHQRAGRLRPGLTPPDAGRILIAAMDGLQVQWLLERDAPDRVDLAEAIRVVLSTLVTVPTDGS